MDMEKMTREETYSSYYRKGYSWRTNAQNYLLPEIEERIKREKVRYVIVEPALTLEGNVLADAKAILVKENKFNKKKKNGKIQSKANRS